MLQGFVPALATAVLALRPEVHQRNDHHEKSDAAQHHECASRRRPPVSNAIEHVMNTIQSAAPSAATAAENGRSLQHGCRVGGPRRSTWQNTPRFVHCRRHVAFYRLRNRYSRPPRRACVRSRGGMVGCRSIDHSPIASVQKQRRRLPPRAAIPGRPRHGSDNKCRRVVFPGCRS